jgi:hypothetical protein
VRSASPSGQPKSSNWSRGVAVPPRCRRRRMTGPAWRDGGEYSNQYSNAVRTATDPGGRAGTSRPCDLRKRHACGRSRTSARGWGSRGRRFKSCQPDRRTAGQRPFPERPGTASSAPLRRVDHHFDHHRAGCGLLQLVCPKWRPAGRSGRSGAEGRRRERPEVPTSPRWAASCCRGAAEGAGPMTPPACALSLRGKPRRAVVRSCPLSPGQGVRRTGAPGRRRDASCSGCISS